MSSKNQTPSRILLPTPPEQYSSAAFSQVFDSLRRALIPLVSRDEATNRIMLKAPNGTIYEVTVDNTGTLHTTVNDGKSRL